MAEGLPKLRFNCYLLRDDLDEAEHALRPAYRPGGRAGMRPLATGPSVPEGVLGFVKERSENVPSWAAALAPLFPELNNVLNMSNRLVIILPVKDRKFAVCFGYGSTTLDWSAIETNFGLRFAARRLDPNALNELRSRRIDASSRTQSVQLPGGSDLRDFDLALDGEFVRKLAGKLDDEGISFGDIGAIVATDSVAFKADTDLTKVANVLESMLSEVSTRQVHDELAFVDSLEPLRGTSDIVRRLESLLAVSLFDGVRNGAPQRVKDEAEQGLDEYFLEFSPPDGVSVNNVETVTIFRGQPEEDGAKASLPSLNLAGLKSALVQLGGRFGRGSLKSLRLMAYGSDGLPASPLLPLKNWLVFEAGHSEQRFILTLGRWFSLQEVYTARLNQDLSRIAIITDELSLPTWTATDREEKYNADAAGDRYICLDQVDIRPDDGDEVEACDLFSKQGHLIHVKRYNGSQTLSHLFAQGFVSAQLIAGDQVYRDAFLKVVHSLGSDFATAAEQAPQTVTYAIGMQGDRKIPDDLPSFSKVNLRDFAKRLRSSRVVPTLCRIQMIEDAI